MCFLPTRNRVSLTRYNTVSGLILPLQKAHLSSIHHTLFIPPAHSVSMAARRLCFFLPLIASLIALIHLFLKLHCLPSYDFLPLPSHLIPSRLLLPACVPASCLHAHAIAESLSETQTAAMTFREHGLIPNIHLHEYAIAHELPSFVKQKDVTGHVHELLQEPSSHVLVDDPSTVDIAEGKKEKHEELKSEREPNLTELHAAMTSSETIVQHFNHLEQIVGLFGDHEVSEHVHYKSAAGRNMVTEGAIIHQAYLLQETGSKSSEAERPVDISSNSSQVSIARMKVLSASSLTEIPQPSVNATVEERLRWLRMSWGSMKILHSDQLAQQFSKRIDKFLAGKATDSKNTQKCSVQVFMTWLSPLSLFGPREQLVLESVFKTHPAACVIILSRSLDSSKGRALLWPFAERGFKVLAVAPDVPFLLKSTPAKKWFQQLKKGLIDPGGISFNQNLSNLLRLLVLYKYGGIYLDSDVILMRDLSQLSNTLGAQSVNKETGKWSRLNNAVMIFDHRSPMLFKFIQEFSHTFNGSKWGHNGPYLVSRVVSRLMKDSRFNCTVLPPQAFYPVDWEHIEGFFRAPKNAVDRQWVITKMLQLGQSFSIHLWNKRSREIEVQPGSLIELIFKMFCVLCDKETQDGALRAPV